MKATNDRPLTGINVLMACVPADGHFNPLLPIARYLQQQGADVQWYTSNIFAPKLKALNIPHWPFRRATDINAQNVDQALPERKRIKDKIARLNFDMIQGFAARSAEYYQDISTIAQVFPFNVLICDSMFSAIPFIKEKMNIPVISIGVIPLAEASKDVYPYGLGLTPGRGMLDTLKRHIMHLVARNMLLSQSIAFFNNILVRNGLAGTRTDLADTLIKRADAVMQIGIADFEYKRRNLGSNITFIGALYPFTKQTGQPAWSHPKLLAYRKIILVTQGTVEKDTSKLLVPALEAFKNTDVLLIVTTGGSQTAELRQQYSHGNIIIEDFIPFKDILPYCKIFITNGGYGGVLQSLEEGVPIIAAGVHEGKSEICARIGYFKTGINLKTETPTPKQLTMAAEEIMKNGEYYANANRMAAKLSKYQPEKTVMQTLMKLVQSKTRYTSATYLSQLNFSGPAGDY